MTQLDSSRLFTQSLISVSECQGTCKTPLTLRGHPELSRFWRQVRRLLERPLKVGNSLSSTKKRRYFYLQTVFGLFLVRSPPLPCDDYTRKTRQGQTGPRPTDRPSWDNRRPTSLPPLLLLFHSCLFLFDSCPNPNYTRLLSKTWFSENFYQTPYSWTTLWYVGYFTINTTVKSKCFLHVFY